MGYVDTIGGSIYFTPDESDGIGIPLLFCGETGQNPGYIGGGVRYTADYFTRIRGKAKTDGGCRPCLCKCDASGVVSIEKIFSDFDFDTSLFAEEWIGIDTIVELSSSSRYFLSACVNGLLSSVGSCAVQFKDLRCTPLISRVYPAQPEA